MANITKRGKGYRIKVSCGYDINGKQLTKSMTWTPSPKLTTKQIEKELQRQAVLFEEKCKTGQFLDGTTKFVDFVDIWWKDYAEKQLKAKTLVRYEMLLKRIIPAIGHIKLCNLQPMHLTAFYNNLEEDNIKNQPIYKCIIDFPYYLKTHQISKSLLCQKANISYPTIARVCNRENVTYQTAQRISAAINRNIDEVFELQPLSSKLSPRTIASHHRLISSILTTAVLWQVIPHNPCERVKPPKIEETESRYLDDKDIIKLFQYLIDQPLKYRVAITLLIYSGMRKGEVCGLKWADIDFKHNLIHVQRELLYLPNRGIYEDTTKTSNSKRVIKIAATALVLLKDYKKEQSIIRLKCGDLWHNNDYIFTQWDGKPMHPDTLANWFTKFIKDNQLPYVTLHSLRHTNASLLIANGVNLVTVSKRLGHANTAITTRVYAHAIKTADEAAANILQNIFEPNPNNDQIMTNETNSKK